LLHVSRTLSLWTAGARTLALIPALAGCTDGELGAPAREQGAVVKGVLSDPNDDAVVLVQATGRSCSGTLIAPNVVLTALHCISQFDTLSNFNCRSDGTLAPESTGGDIGPLLDPATVYVLMGVQAGNQKIYAKALFGTGTPQICRDDIGVIVLKADAPIGSAPLVSLRFGPSAAPELTRVVGYGDTVGTSTENGRQERDHLPLLGVGARTNGGAGDPNVAPRTLLVGEGPCHGDSGGPLYSEETGAQLGVYSLLLSQTCVGPDVKNTYTQIAPFEGFIRDALASAGQEPIVEPTGSGGDTTVGSQGGEAGTPGAAGDVGAAGSEGANGGSGGSGAAGGLKATGGNANGGTGATSGTTAATGGSSGDGSGATGANGTGSGSRRDASCTCRAGGPAEPSPWSLGVLAGAVLAVARRRYRR